MSEAADWLEAWGRWARQTSDSLGYPRASTISRMIDYARAFPNRQQGNGRYTARGTQKRVMRPKEVDTPPAQVMEIDRQIASLPASLQAPLWRHYVYRQPDRIAARELKESRASYTARRERAEQTVVERVSA